MSKLIMAKLASGDNIALRAIPMLEYTKRRGRIFCLCPSMVINDDDVSVTDGFCIVDLLTGVGIGKVYETKDKAWTTFLFLSEMMPNEEWDRWLQNLMADHGPVNNPAAFE